MKTIWRSAPWVNRFALAAPTVIFTMIGWRYITDPVHASAATGAVLSSALAATTTRIGYGAFPLTIAIFSLACLTSSRRLVAGVSLVAILMATVIMVRLFSAATDGAVPESTRLFVPELIILLLSLTGLLLESRRQKEIFKEKL